MKFIQRNNRTQIILFPVSPDQSIDPDNEVRMIDLFADSTSSFQAAAASEFVTYTFKETDYTQ